MKNSLARLKALPPEKLDEGLRDSILAQARNQQGLIFDTSQMQEPEIRKLAEEVGAELPEVQATADEVNQERNSREGAARFDWWATTGKNGKRLAPIKFNMDRVVDILKKIGGLSAVNIDRAIEIAGGTLQWVEGVPAPVPAPAPPTPPAPPPVRILPS